MLVRKNVQRLFTHFEIMSHLDTQIDGILIQKILHIFWISAPLKGYNGTVQWKVAFDLETDSFLCSWIRIRDWRITVSMLPLSHLAS